MNVSVRAALDTLICAEPNESSDEPYLWTFFLKLDGDTVRQVGSGFVGAGCVSSSSMRIRWRGFRSGAIFRIDPRHRLSAQNRSRFRCDASPRSPRRALS
jgi:hypothetical protein